jgi:type IV pilus assembly protein PilM
LIAEALNQFIERNDIEDDKVAVSVPGQSGLAKFFKPPPIELKKLRDIVKFEAKQQIPSNGPVRLFHNQALMVSVDCMR